MMKPTKSATRVSRPSESSSTWPSRKTGSPNSNMSSAAPCRSAAASEILNGLLNGYAGCVDDAADQIALARKNMWTSTKR